MTRASDSARVAIVADLREERWPSMDLVADMLLLNLRALAAPRIDATEMRPSMTHRLVRLPLVGRTTRAATADRILNRVWDYPRWLRPRARDFDLFHIVDHSYAHLATRLPADRSLVTCHDLDAFRSVLPGCSKQGIVQRALSRHLIEGMRAARKVLCGTAAMRDDLVSAAIVPAERAVVVPFGVHPSCSARSDTGADRDAAAMLGPADGRIELLHVGSTIPRKRIDALLKIFAVLGAKRPGVRLVQVGGALTPQQQRLAERLDVRSEITVLPFLERPVLAAVYRRAALVLQTSDREGFGLPVAEAMACGTPVVASDLPALREVGGPAATYRPVGDVERWTNAVILLLDERAGHSERWRTRQADGIRWAKRFDWQAHAEATVDVYREVLSNRLPDRHG